MTEPDDDGSRPYDFHFTKVRVWTIEVEPGTYIAVGIVTCLTCGAAILLDAADDADMRQLHVDWHARGS